jgi:16S rRNA G1207 methylase RsmC
VPRYRPVDDDDEDSPGLPRPHSSERLLIEHFPVPVAGRILCTSLGRGQLAAYLAVSNPDEHVDCWTIDRYIADQTADALEIGEIERVEITCSPDLPERSYDLIAIPVSHRGVAELVRDILQQACERVAPGGAIVCGVDNPTDRWLHDELRKLAPKVRREPRHHGVVYTAFVDGPPKRPRNFKSQFAFRDRENLIQLVSRPGVFSHREVDLGARALLESVDAMERERVLDIGCGSGAVGLALARRADGVVLHGIDSNARAAQCLMEGAALNGLTAVTAAMTATGEIAQPGTFNLAAGNPPYYSNFQIAEIFVQAARRALKPGGRVAMVTRKPEWFVARFKQLFDEVTAKSVRTYTIVSAIQRIP